MGCGCKKKTCKTCCGNVSYPTPLQPFCGPTSSCPEDHCQEIISQQFVAALKITNSWNVPDCGGSATLYISGLVAVSIGSYLWNSQYGYFEVIGFDKDTNQVTVENPCIEGNAPEGTTVPACTYFIVTDTPLGASGGGAPSLYPYVAIDFTAPNDSTCLLITVTNVNGLVVGKNVQIGAGMYRIESIPDGTHITICNDGDGITPGTPVIAKNEANQYQYPITLIDANPCTNDGVADGCLVVCKDNIMSPLGVTANLLAGMVPVIMEDESCEVEYRMLEVPTKTCSSITCCLTLQNGVASYVVNVADSSQFTVGDILQIGTRTDRAEITSIPDATHIVVTITPTPGALVDIEPGTSICIVDCCELLEIYVDSEDFRCGDFENDIFVDEQSFSANTQTINSGNTTASTGTQIMVITNESECRDMYCYGTVWSLIFGNATGANTATLNVDSRLGYSLVADPPTDVIGGATHLFARTDAATQFTLQRFYNAIIGPVLPGGGTANLVHNAQAIWTGTGASAFEIPGIFVQASVIGVAV